MRVSVFSTDSKAEEAALATAQLFHSNTEDKELNRSSRLKGFLELVNLLACSLCCSYVALTYYTVIRFHLCFMKLNTVVCI